MVDMRHKIGTHDQPSSRFNTNHKPYSIVDCKDDTPAVKTTHKSFNHDAIDDDAIVLHPFTDGKNLSSTFQRIWSPTIKE